MTTPDVRVFVEHRKRAKSPYGEHFMMLSQRGVAELAQRLADRSLGMQAVRTLVAMLEHMDFENRVDISQKDLALELEIDQSALAKASKALVECGFIERMANRRGWYRVSPRLCWKGSAKNLEAELSRQAA
jgi:transcription initiation factor IIE alpha subunit